MSYLVKKGFLTIYLITDSVGAHGYCGDSYNFIAASVRRSPNCSCCVFWVSFLSKIDLPILEDLPLDGTSKTNIIFLESF